jgi:hypothetical protein
MVFLVRYFLKEPALFVLFATWRHELGQDHRHRQEPQWLSISSPSAWLPPYDSGLSRRRCRVLTQDELPKGPSLAVAN